MGLIENARNASRLISETVRGGPFTQRFEFLTTGTSVIYYDCAPNTNLSSALNDNPDFERHEDQYKTSWQRKLIDGLNGCAITIGEGKAASEQPGVVHVSIVGADKQFVSSQGNTLVKDLQLKPVPMGRKRRDELMSKFDYVLSRR